jgi:hypothetical protein
VLTEINALMEELMVLLNGDYPGNAPAKIQWLPDQVAGIDVFAVLREHLHSEWTVAREVDPSGDVSIIVFPRCPDTEEPTFIIYECGGLAHVAKVFDEIWQDDGDFITCRQAVQSVLMATRKRKLS